MRISFLIGIWFVGFSLEAFASERIQAIRFDKSKVESVFITPGLVTVMVFPCEIDEAIVGRDQDVKAVVSQTTKKQLSIFASSSLSASTNLIVRCGKKSDLFVFDLITSKRRHQDLVKVSSSYSQPDEISLTDAVLIDSSSSHVLAKKKKQIIEISPPVLVEESK